MLSEGDEAPDFTLPDANGKTYSMKDFAGKKVVLYFYPKDDTPGCTIEGCEFSKLQENFTKNNAIVIGVSGDTASSHLKFKEKYHLTIPLLIDEGNKVARLYGAWGLKKFMGREYEGIIRSTFLIKDTKVIKAMYSVKAEGHAMEIFELVKRK